MSKMSREEETSLFIVRLAQRLSIIVGVCLESGTKALDWQAIDGSGWVRAWLWLHPLQVGLVSDDVTGNR